MFGDESFEKTTREVFECVEQKIVNDSNNLEKKYHTHGIIWKPRILHSWTSFFNKLPLILNYFMFELPLELQKFNEMVEKDDIFSTIIFCSDRGKFIEKLVGDILEPDFSFNHRNYYPDYVLNYHNYSDYLRPIWNGNSTVFSMNPRMVLGEFVSNVPDGVEIKCSSTIGTKGGFIYSHGPQCGLHIVFSYEKDNSNFIKILQIWVGYIAEEDKILRNRNKETTTIKYVFHTNKLQKLL